MRRFASAETRTSGHNPGAHTTHLLLVFYALPPLDLQREGHHLQHQNNEKQRNHTLKQRGTSGSGITHDNDAPDRADNSEG